MSIDREKLRVEAEQAKARSEARVAAQQAAQEEKVQEVVDRWLAHILPQVLATGRAGQGVYHYSLDKETAKLYAEARRRVEERCKADGMFVAYRSSYNEQGYGETMGTTMFVASSQDLLPKDRY